MSPSLSHIPAIAGLATFLAVASAAGASHACKDQAMKRLGELGVASKAITHILIADETTTEGDIEGYKAWTSMKGCKGYVVVDLDLQCGPSQEYTTRDCAISGVSNY